MKSLNATEKKGERAICLLMQHNKFFALIDRLDHFFINQNSFMLYTQELQLFYKNIFFIIIIFCPYLHYTCVILIFPASHFLM